MLETQNLKLKKPGDNDILDPSLSLNPNMDIIDKEIGKIKEDMKNMSSDAEGTSYDNTNSKLTSTNVQSALDEINTKTNENKKEIEQNKKDIGENKTSISNLDLEIKETNKNLKTLGYNFNELNSESKNWQKYKVTDDNGRCKSSSNQDANNITLGGCYNGVDMLHMPNDSNEWWYLEVISHSSSGYCYQVATQLTSAGPKKYHRTQVSGTWNYWRRL